MAETPRSHFVAHVLPAWISAICAVLALVVTFYTLILVDRTTGNVSMIMSAMHAMRSAPVPAAPVPMAAPTAH